MHDLEENFRILRVTVESHTALPAVFTVSSALAGDGGTFVACGLARAFAEAGHSTLLVEANVQGNVASELGIIGLGQRNAIGGIGARTAELDKLSVASLGFGEKSFKGNLSSLVSNMRAAYRVVIFDAAPIPESGAALELAREANGVLLAVKLGRRPHASDRMLQQLIGENRSRLIGVVPTKPHRRHRLADTVTIPTVVDVPARPFRAPKSVEVGR